MSGIKKRLVHVGILALVVLLISGCSSEEKWGIDARPNADTIEMCGDGEDEGLANAILVEPSSIVENIAPDTKIRIWHYQNADKLVCVIQGAAILVENTSNTSNTL